MGKAKTTRKQIHPLIKKMNKQLTTEKMNEQLTADKMRVVEAKGTLELRETAKALVSTCERWHYIFNLVTCANSLRLAAYQLARCEDTIADAKEYVRDLAETIILPETKTA